MQDDTWTDDAGFWDEAWQDMEQRLDATSADRRAVPWWRWGVLLAVALVSGIIYLTSYQDNEARPPVQSELVAATDQADNQGTQREAAWATDAVSSKTGAVSSGAASVAKVDNWMEPEPAVGRALRSFARPAADPVHDVNNQSITRTSAQPTTTKTATVDKSDVGRAPQWVRLSRPDSALRAAVLDEEGRAWRPSPIGPLPSVAGTSDLGYVKVLGPPTILQSAMNLTPTIPEPQLTKTDFNKRDVHWSLGSTVSAPVVYGKPSADMMLGYERLISNRLGYRVGLGYGLTTRRITDVNFTSDGAEVNAPSTPTTSVLEDGQLLAGLQLAEFDQVSYHGPKLLVDFNYRLGKRITVGFGASGTYLISLESPRVTSASGNDLLVADFSSGNGQNLQVAGGAFGNVVNTATVNRWLWSGRAEVAYDLSPRWRVAGHGSYLLSNLFAEEEISVERTQVGLSVYFRW